MKISYSKRFTKQFKKLPCKLQSKITKTIERLIKDPSDTSLKNHKLRGLMLGKRAVSVSANIRLIFEEYNNYTHVIFIDVGGHEQVYK